MVYDRMVCDRPEMRAVRILRERIIDEDGDLTEARVGRAKARPREVAPWVRFKEIEVRIAV
jgi:hypothetical protein